MHTKSLTLFVLSLAVFAGPVADPAQANSAVAEVAQPAFTVGPVYAYGPIVQPQQPTQRRQPQPRASRNYNQEWSQNPGQYRSRTWNGQPDGRYYAPRYGRAGAEPYNGASPRNYNGNVPPTGYNRTRNGKWQPYWGPRVPPQWNAQRPPSQPAAGRRYAQPAMQ
jgi:hypothetical protein